MKLRFILFFLIFQIPSFGQTIKMNITHDDNLLIFFQTTYGAQIEFLSDPLFVDSCHYEGKLWALSYDTTKQLQWYHQQHRCQLSINIK